HGRAWWGCGRSSELEGQGRRVFDEELGVFELDVEALARGFVRGGLGRELGGSVEALCFALGFSGLAFCEHLLASLGKRGHGVVAEALRGAPEVALVGAIFDLAN